MKLIVIIVTYNGETWIRECLSSVLHSSIKADILVIDNDSKDKTVSIVRNEFPNVSLTKTGKNLGFGKANNIGINKALKLNADYIVLLNQDTRVNESVFEQLVRVSKSYPEFGIISPLHLNYDGSRIEHYFSNYVIGQYSPEYINDLHFKNLKEIYSASFIHAACWLMPVKTLIKVGGFDPLFFHCGEDNDYIQRLVHKNLKVGFVPNAIIFHHGTNDGLLNPKQNISFQVNQSIILLKNPSASLAGVLIVFLKNAFDGMSSALLFRNFKQFRAGFKIFWINLKRIKGIAASRLEQNREKAYLDN